MALRVGELTAALTIDDSGTDRGMARSEQAVRAGADRIQGTADAAGQQAGTALGDGIADGTADGADRAATGIRAKLKSFAATAVGASIGAALMAGISEALEQGKISSTLQAQLGTTGPVAAQHGKAAGALYAAAIVDSVQEGADVIRGIAQNGLLPPEATQAQIQTMGRRVADTAKVMGEDVGAVSRAIGTMLKTGVAQNAQEAMDVLVRGTQRGANAGEDLLDTFSEYSTQFRDLGLDAKTSMGLLQQGLQGGARDADTVADALKEFAIRSKDMSASSVQAFKDIGLNADQMAATFTKGGPAASKALGDVLTRIKAIEDPAKRNAVAVALFGTKAEDLQGALFKLNPATAVAALGQVKGAADAAGHALHDNAATRVEAFKRSLSQGFVEIIGTQVIPALMTGASYAVRFGAALGTAGAFVAQNQGVFIAVAAVITTVMLPALIRLAVQATTTSTATVTSWTVQGAAATAAAGRFVIANALIVAGWIRQGAAATAAGARVVAAWLMQGAAATPAVARFLLANALILAGWIRQGAAATAAAVRVVAAWVLMGTQSMVQAARMAAAWVLAMGPVGWVTAAVIALAALVIANWGKVKAATAAAWTWIWSKIKAVAGFLVGVFMNWTLPGLIIKHWSTIKSATSTAWNAVVNFVKAIPGRIVSFFLNWTLPGLIIRHWSRIRSATSTAWNAVIAFVRSIPGRIVSFFVNWTLPGVIIRHWQSIKTGTVRKAGEMLAYVRTLPGKIVGYFGNFGTMLVSAGKDLVRGLWTGITSMGDWLKSKVKGFAGGIVDSVTGALGIGSPSKVMASKVGRWIPAGVAAGIRSEQGVVDATMRRLVPIPAAPQFTPAPAAGPAPAAAASGGSWGPAVHIENWHAGSASPDQTAAALAWQMKARG
ncbi:phage tail tape measure protein [Streptomyces sp. XD-27]|uniref:phage tail tape measure protein n=1 Tax=Streptomyces sp. XD-27 TaxID=3062779 RepID=UPI0026F46B19|nr:phage tail tape measure protein [Streptomyces sp. XD-27]WKX70052.1 phage tail tape measure protein [Streptomyces sp. XD-27]